MARRWPALVVAIPAALLLFVFLVVLFIPAAELKGVAGRALGRAGYTLKAEGFAKAFPLGLKVRNMEIGDDRGALLKADEAVVRLRLLPLFVGRVSFACRAELGKGELHGDFSPFPGAGADVTINHLRLEDIPFFQTAAGLRIKGDLKAEASFKGKGLGAKGDAWLQVNGAELAGAKIGELPLPDATYDSVRMAAEVKGGKIVLKSATLQGAGLYVRLKGDFPATAPLGSAPLNLTLELMPKPDFLERQKFVFLLLAKYLTSPGAYQIPIRGVLAKPAIQ